MIVLTAIEIERRVTMQTQYLKKILTLFIIVSLCFLFDRAHAAVVPADQECGWKRVLVDTEILVLTDAFGPYTVLRPIFLWRWVCRPATT
jgi:hypothetical protein